MGLGLLIPCFKINSVNLLRRMSECTRVMMKSVGRSNENENGRREARLVGDQGTISPPLRHRGQSANLEPICLLPRPFVIIPLFVVCVLLMVTKCWLCHLYLSYLKISCSRYRSCCFSLLLVYTLLHSLASPSLRIHHLACRTHVTMVLSSIALYVRLCIFMRIFILAIPSVPP